MIKSNIIKAKIRRRNINFKYTYLYDDAESLNINQSIFSDVTLKDNEEIILYHDNLNNYNWIITNQRLLFPFDELEVPFSQICDVNFDSIMDSPENKMSNCELILVLKDGKVKIFLEKGTWPLVYEIFKFIIGVT